jgi:hypothetical protein
MKSTMVSWPRSVEAKPSVNRLDPASRNDAAQSSGENENSRQAKPTNSRPSQTARVRINESGAA